MPSAALRIEREPIAINSAEVPIFSHFIGSFDTNFAPKSTAAPVSKANAMVNPISTVTGGCSAAKVSVMSCVLSPSSINATIEKAATKGRWLFLFDGFSFTFRGMSGKTPKTMKKGR